MKRLISILGPTASGKSAVALAMAERLDGEIISCDSMQVYRGMDIGTATPAPDELARVPHHLVNALDIAEPYDVQAFTVRAQRAIRDILARGRQPILCGGTGYYAKVLLYGLPLPPSDPTIAADVLRDFDELGEEALREELRAIDPAALERAGDNPRRLQRAVEIVRLTGKPVPDQVEANPPDFAGPQLVLVQEPALAREHIARRTRRMLADGWIDETERLVANGLLESPTAIQALGYAQIAEWIAAGRRDLEALTEQLIIRTRQYARRQRTWFRHQHPGAVMVPIDAEWPFPRVLDRCLHLVGECRGTQA